MKVKTKIWMNFSDDIMKVTKFYGDGLRERKKSLEKEKYILEDKLNIIKNELDVIEEHQNKVKCPFCERLFDSNKYLKSHIKSKREYEESDEAHRKAYENGRYKWVNGHLKVKCESCERFITLNENRVDLRIKEQGIYCVCCD